MKHIFILNLDIPPQQILIAIGCKHKDVMKYMSKKVDEDKIKFLEESKEIFDELNNGKVGGFVAIDDEFGGFILGVKEFKNNWEYWDILNHEVSHVTDLMLTRKAAQNETEFRAYTHEFIFKTIREELYRKFPSKEVLDTPQNAPESTTSVLNDEKV